MTLNKKLIKEQNLNEKDIKKIEKLHNELTKIFEEAIDNKDDLDKLKKLSLEVEKIEYKLQEAWKFSINKDFHSWWYRLPGCECPKMDNQELVGTGLRIYSNKCKIHN